MRELALRILLVMLVGMNFCLEAILGLLSSLRPSWEE